MTRILAARGVLPPHEYTQQELTDGFGDLIVDASGLDRGVLRRLHGNAGVATRHLTLPLPSYAGLDDFGRSNDVFLEHAVPLGAEAVSAALKQAGLAASDVDLVVSTTITGVAVPSLEARIAPLVGLRPDVVRVPLLGLGCMAGAAGVARLHDYLLGHPDQVAVLVSVELCSLTVQRGDVSVANLVASGLFGDGAAAVVAVGEDHPVARTTEPGAGPTVLASRSRLYPDTERAMGWDVRGSGFQIVLGAEVPQLVRVHLGADVDAFLAAHGLGRDDIDWWVAHPGGPKVLEAMQEALALDRSAVALTWESLNRIGNLSSASVLHVLDDTLRERPPAPGSYGLLLAMGPGFALELVLLRG
jgi:alkylresorcinol/alkylpyrone synthase